MRYIILFFFISILSAHAQTGFNLPVKQYGKLVQMIDESTVIVFQLDQKADTEKYKQEKINVNPDKKQVEIFKNRKEKRGTGFYVTYWSVGLIKENGLYKIKK